MVLSIKTNTAAYVQFPVKCRCFQPLIPTRMIKNNSVSNQSKILQWALFSDLRRELKTCSYTDFSPPNGTNRAEFVLAEITNAQSRKWIFQPQQCFIVQLNSCSADEGCQHHQRMLTRKQKLHLATIGCWSKDFLLSSANVCKNLSRHFLDTFSVAGSWCLFTQVRIVSGRTGYEL